MSIHPLPSSLFFRIRGAIVLPLLWCLGATAWGQNVQFRAVVSPGLERAEAVVPHETGAFLVSTSKLPDTELLRGYVVHYDSELNVDWSRLLPCPALLEEVLDAWSDEAGVVTVLTQRLTPLEGYETVLHRLDSVGTWLGEFTPSTPQGFRAATKVTWLGDDWIVGATGTQPTAVNLATGDTQTWGGAPGALDEVTDATVVGSLLVAVGSRTEDDTTATAIWGVYPLGQTAFEIVNPDPEAGAFSRADAVASNGTNFRVLHSYRPPAPDDQWLLHSMLSVSPTTGSTVGILYGPSGGQRPGRDLAWTEDGWVKLTQTDGFVLLDRSMLLTHYSPNGTYQSQGAWGTAFEDDPAHVTQGADGALWVAGSTRGFAGGTWDACVMRLDSIGPLGSWASDMMGLGVYNDPLFDEVTSVSDATLHHGWRCSPNPASERTTLRLPAGMDDALVGNVRWTLLDPRGRALRQGQGTEVDLSGCAPGMHVVRVEHQGTHIHVQVLVEGRF